MVGLYKVSEHFPVHSKEGISIGLAMGTENGVAIKINKEVELNLRFEEKQSFVVNGREYTVRLVNTFSELWGKPVTCYVFELNDQVVSDCLE